MPTPPIAMLRMGPHVTSRALPSTMHPITRTVTTKRSAVGDSRGSEAAPLGGVLASVTFVFSPR